MQKIIDEVFDEYGWLGDEDEANPKALANALIKVLKGLPVHNVTDAETWEYGTDFKFAIDQKDILSTIEMIKNKLK